MTLSKKKDKSTETVPEIDLIADLPYKDFFFLFRDTPTTYGSSQAKSQIGSATAGLCHSHNNANPYL